MQNTSISYHKFTMHKKYNPAKKIALNSFREKGIIDVLAKYIKNNCVRIQEEKEHKFLIYNKSQENILINEESTDESDKKQSDYTFLYWNKYESKTIQSNGRDSYSYIHFLILGGKKGDFRVICNPFGEITSLQTPEEAGMNFFNVFVAIPSDPDSIEGMIILEHKGIYSIQSAFFKNFNKFYNDDDITMKIYNISDYDVVEKLIQIDPIQELKLIKYFKNTDKSEPNYCEQEKRIYVKPKFPHLRTALRGMFQQGKCIGTEISRIDTFSPTDVSVTFDIGDSRRKTYGISNFQNIALVEYIDKNDGIKYDTKLEPTFDSIGKVMAQKFEEHKAVLKVADNN